MKIYADISHTYDIKCIWKFPKLIFRKINKVKWNLTYCWTQAWHQLSRAEVSSIFTLRWWWLRLSVSLSSWASKQPTELKFDPNITFGKLDENLIFFCISCHQLITALKVDEMKLNLESFSVYMKIPVNFSKYQLSTAFSSWRQLISVDENEGQHRDLKFGIHINFSVHLKTPVNTFYILKF